MKTVRLPLRGIVLIEDDSELRESLASDLRPLADDIVTFANSGEAIHWFNTPQCSLRLEVIVAVTDGVGIPFLAHVGGRGQLYPSARKILYSGAATDASVMAWKSDRIIDTYIMKGYRDILLEEVRSSIEEYQKRDVLSDMRRYIECKCRNPRAPYYPCDDGRVLNIIEVYQEIMLGTTVGKEAAESWVGMREAESAPHRL